MTAAELEIIIVDLKKIVIETESIKNEAVKNLENSRLVLEMMEYQFDREFGGKDFEQ